MIDVALNTAAGIVLPAEVLTSQFFTVLAGFVAFNTLVYVALAVGKILPHVPVGDWWFRARGETRRESRSIYPDGS